VVFFDDAVNLAYVSLLMINDNVNESRVQCSRNAVDVLYATLDVELSFVVQELYVSDIAIMCVNLNAVEYLINCVVLT